jgi:hypothetical protein
MKVSRATPVLFVDHVEPTRDFFLAVGFKVIVEVPRTSGSDSRSSSATASR